MSYDPNDHNEYDPEHEEREAYDERFDAFCAGLCSRRAAVSGGAEYLHDLAETAMELKESGCAMPAALASASARTCMPHSDAEPRRERSAA
jgi:hypothetical protein